MNPVPQTPEQALADARCIGPDTDAIRASRTTPTEIGERK